MSVISTTSTALRTWCAVFALGGITGAATSCGDPSSSTHAPASSDTVDANSACADANMGLRPPSPRSLDEVAARSDVIAVVEITDRYEQPGSRSVDEIVTRGMATATVRAPISGAAVNEKLQVYVSRVSRTPDGEIGAVLGGYHDEHLLPGTQLVAAFVEDEPGQYELTGGELLIDPDGTISVLGRDGCRTEEEVALAREITGRPLSGIVSDLHEAVSVSPTTLPELTVTATTGS